MWTFLVTLAAVAALAHGHGRVLDPPGRGSIWRAGYSDARPNYDDDGLNCGGFHNQHSVNGGRCGVCGDPFDAAQPRAHERGGIYDSGIIGATYEAGSVISVTVQITAYHKGYWELRICPDPTSSDQACFDQYLLELEEGGTKYYLDNGSSTYVVKYRLPSDLTCDNCVLQWKYICGNNWGVCSNGSQGLGCGDQENFGACSDISIVGGSDGSSNDYIPVDSLLLSRLNEIGLIKLMYSGYMKPHYWASSTVPPPRKNTKRRKHKGKKKVKPYKSKWSNYWR